MLKKPAPAAAAPVPARTHRRRRAAIKTIDLALQGGGSHGAFTWGVLDRLLEEEWLEVAAISGTSAGAMNAVALAAVSAPIGAWWNPWMEPLARVAAQWSGQFSPYQLNPLNLNPLRDVLAATVDFDRVRHCTKSQLFIAATQVRTGALRVFAQRDLSADVVLASACLPLLFQAVEIDGEAYWDGGYAGNPSLMPLITDGPADDLLLVQINPIERAELPTRADDILDRINEVTFNSSLLKELRLIALLQQLVAGQRRSGHADGEKLFERIRALRVHLLDGGEALGALGASSKTNTQWTFLTRLHALGRASAEHWLAEHGNTIGLRSSFDPATVLRM